MGGEAPGQHGQGRTGGSGGGGRASRSVCLRIDCFEGPPTRKLSPTHLTRFLALTLKSNRPKATFAQAALTTSQEKHGSLPPAVCPWEAGIHRRPRPPSGG